MLKVFLLLFNLIFFLKFMTIWTKNIKCSKTQFHIILASLSMDDLRKFKYFMENSGRLTKTKMSIK